MDGSKGAKDHRQIYAEGQSSHCLRMHDEVKDRQLRAVDDGRPGGARPKRGPHPSHRCARCTEARAGTRPPATPAARAECHSLSRIRHAAPALAAQAIARAKKAREDRKNAAPTQIDGMQLDPQAAELNAAGGLKSKVLSEDEIELRWETSDETG